MSVQDQIPKSRLTLKYKTEVNGEPAIVDLPLRLMVLGDFSGGSSKDRKTPLDERRLRSLSGNNMDSLMKDMGMRLKMVVPNKIDPEKGEQLEVDLPIEKLASFNPDEVARNVPKLKGLLMVKKLLEEASSNVANKKEFRKLLNDLYASESAFKAVMDELKDFGGVKLPDQKK